LEHKHVFINSICFLNYLTEILFRLKSNDFPIHLLPEVKKTGTIAGFTKLNWLSIESNTPVMVAFGDMQCSCFANLKNSKNTAGISFILKLNYFYSTLI
jgi:glycerol kinase